MRALLLHDRTPDDAAGSVLAAAGHEVLRCGPPRPEGLACDGVLGACPLDATVDVAVLVHDRPSTQIAVGEAGAVCALRDGVPLVIAGNGAYSPLAEWASAVARTIEQIPDACAAAVDAAAAGAAVQIGEAVGCDVGVRRIGDAIEVWLPADTSEKTAVLAHQAARQRFRGARTIDVLRG